MIESAPCSALTARHPNPDRRTHISLIMITITITIT